MEKVIFYRIYYYEDMREGQKYYYKDKTSCEVARFLSYKKYDYERITHNNFVVPVSKVNSVLIHEDDIHKIEFCMSQENDTTDLTNEQ